MTPPRLFDSIFQGVKIICVTVTTPIPSSVSLSSWSGPTTETRHGVRNCCVWSIKSCSWIYTWRDIATIRTSQICCSCSISCPFNTVSHTSSCQKSTFTYIRLCRSWSIRLAEQFCTNWSCRVYISSEISLSAYISTFSSTSINCKLFLSCLWSCRVGITEITIFTIIICQTRFIIVATFASAISSSGFAFITIRTWTSGKKVLFIYISVDSVCFLDTWRNISWVLPLKILKSFNISKITKCCAISFLETESCSCS